MPTAEEPAGKAAITIRCTGCRNTPGRSEWGLCPVCRGSCQETFTLQELEERLVAAPVKFLYLGIPIRSEAHLRQMLEHLGLSADRRVGLSEPGGGPGSGENGRGTRPQAPPRPPLPPLPRPPMWKSFRVELEEEEAAKAEADRRFLQLILRRPPLLVGADGAFQLRPAGRSPVAIAGLACEWNPWRKAPALEQDLAHARAVFTVGRGRQALRLCPGCAARPPFHRRRRELLTASGGGDGSAQE